MVEFLSVLERSQRPMREEDRRALDQHRQRDIGGMAFEAKYAFFGGAAGLALGFVWLAAFHFGDREHRPGRRAYGYKSFRNYRLRLLSCCA